MLISCSSFSSISITLIISPIASEPILTLKIKSKAAHTFRSETGVFHFFARSSAVAPMVEGGRRRNGLRQE